MSVNKVILLGHIGQDPEVKYLDGGVIVANFSLATSEKFKNRSGEEVESTEWHRVVAYGKTAQLIEKYIKKGDKLYIEGKLKTRSWEKEGTKHYLTEIIVNEVQFLGAKKSTENVPGQPAQYTTAQPVAPASNEPVDDQLPF